MRILGLGFSIAIIFGGTVGVGILRLPGEIAGSLGSSFLILTVWIIGGLYALLGAISLSELGAALPEAGGFYVYSKRAFGPMIGFAMGWADWICNCASIAITTVAASEYLIALVPSIGAQPSHQRTLALSLLLLFSGIQWLGLRLSSHVQKVTSSVTIITFIVLAIACLVHQPPTVQVFSVQASTLPTGAPHLFGLIAIIAVLPGIVVAYDGWYEAIYFTEEDTNPARHLPRAMIGGVLLITSLYLLMNVAFLHVLTIPAMAQSKLTAADAARVVFSVLGFSNFSGNFITILSLLTLLSSTSAILLGAPRILFAIGRDGLFRSAAEVDSSGTPRIALLITAAMVALFVLSGKFDDILAVAAIVVAAAYSVNYTAVFVLRAREPNLLRPFRAWGFPITTGLVLIGSVAFLVFDIRQDPSSSMRALALLAIAFPIYLFTQWRKGKTLVH